MDTFNLYNDIATRTNGDIYVGVVGPVRTGKSTFIKKFMEMLVLPVIKDKNEQKRATDEMPQPAAGKQVMTTQPKFVPAEAVSLNLESGVNAKIRLIDCVGYMVEGAEGATENGKPRMVRTPWQNEEMPFEKAAEIGTQKVINDHSTIGVLVTTDGSITDIPRNAYVDVEERAVNEMKALGKPFVIVLNTTTPESLDTIKLAEALSDRYGVPVMAKNVLKMGEKDVTDILENILLEFPIKMVDCILPDWMRALSPENKILQELFEKISTSSEGLKCMRDSNALRAVGEENAYFKSANVSTLDTSCGRAVITLEPEENLFYTVLSEECGRKIDGEYSMMSYVRYLSKAGEAYNKLKDALVDVEEKGYGVVAPSLDEMVLEEPEIFKQSGKCGVRLKASAPSLHIMRVEVNTEVNPIVGTEQQGEELVNYLMSEFETNKNGIWETNLFGKSLNSLVREEINNKLYCIPQDAQNKMRKTLGRMVNEGRGGMLCILL